MKANERICIGSHSNPAFKAAAPANLPVMSCATNAESGLNLSSIQPHPTFSNLIAPKTPGGYGDPESSKPAIQPVSRRQHFAKIWLAKPPFLHDCMGLFRQELEKDIDVYWNLYSDCYSV